ncbi:mannosyltransferase [Hoyosella sp. YIM 151337]|uniref:mannosyltransferase n=1 Tax=Hoyosella sp. YIM 151337 TaxID=2992742 RepID=UPI002236571C|nr:mannosyltransferase [Hoyosella sp. YIM 151337]MCW4355081.1 mannosyltransferase [Hoyosella sp. YIM 151337]
MSETKTLWPRVLRWAPLLLTVAVLARLAWTLLVPNATNFLDLHVYVDGAAQLRDGDLYSFRYSENTPEFPLPFTYPPFAALVFYPLSLLSFAVLAIVWQLGIAGALYAVVRLCQRMIIGRGPAADWARVREAMLWTAAGLWTEPVRTTLDYGQINVYLVLLIMIAVTNHRWWVSGGLAGIAAGIKLTPAIAGLYFLARRRYSAAAFSAVAFAATLGVSWLLIREETREYFASYFGDADRIGPVASVWNQSLFGAVHRFEAEGTAATVTWLMLVALCCGLGVAAWRRLDRSDALGTLIAVQLLGLLISPVSWSHHWVWALPLVMWLVYGPFRELRAAKYLAVFWSVVTLAGVPWLLSFAQPTIWSRVEPAGLAWVALVYVAGALAVYALMICCGRRVHLPRESSRDTVRV